MHAHDGRIGGGGAVLQRIGHHIAVILLPDPTFAGHVGTAHQRLQIRAIGARRRRRDRAQRRARRRVDKGPVVIWRVIGKRGDRDIAHDDAALTQHHPPAIRDHADDGRIQAPFGKDRGGLRLPPRL